MSTEGDASDLGTGEPYPLSERGRKHGKPSSWVLVVVTSAAFACGGVALILGWWWLFFTCAGIFALSVPLGALVGIMDDTVQWTLPPPKRATEREHGDPWDRPAPRDGESPS